VREKLEMGAMVSANSVTPITVEEGDDDEDFVEEE